MGLRAWDGILDVSAVEGLAMDHESENGVPISQGMIAPVPAFDKAEFFAVGFQPDPLPGLHGVPAGLGFPQQGGYLGPGDGQGAEMARGYVAFQFQAAEESVDGIGYIDGSGGQSHGA